MKLAADTWVAVLDGARGLILVNEGTAMQPKLAMHKVYHQENPPAHEQGRDRAGRYPDPGGQHRSAVEITDPHKKAEARFVDDIIGALEKEAASGAFEKLVLVAPPVALGEARKAAGAALEAKIIKEIAADWVKMPVPEITAAVVKALEA